MKPKPFPELVNENVDFIWRAVRRLGVPAAEADDATQQVFIVASEKMDDIRAGSERSFLLAVAARVASHTRRAIQRRESARQQLSETPVTARPFVQSSAQRLEARDLLDTVLDTMSPETRIVFALFELEDLSVDDIAEVLALPRGTVATRLRRARKQFEVEAEAQRTAPRRATVVAGRDPTDGEAFRRTLLEAGRSEQLPEASRRRILEGLGVVAPPPALRVDDVGQPSPTLSRAVSTKVVAILAGGGLLAALGVWGVVESRTPSPPSPTTLGPAAPVLAVEASREPSVAERAPDGGPSVDANVPSRSERPRAGPPRPKAQSGYLTRELQLIEQARERLLNHDPGGALSHLARYRREYPRGSLSAEATVLRIEALMAKGDISSATQIGRSYLKRYPTSLYSRRIRSILGAAATTPDQ